MSDGVDMFRMTKAICTAIVMDGRRWVDLGKNWAQMCSVYLALTTAILLTE